MPRPVVAAGVAARAAELNAGATPLGSVGLVVGATVGDAVRATGTDLEAVNGPLLAPGVGAQGAGERELATVFGAARRQVLASSSRGVLAAGPDAGALRAAAERAASEARAALRG
jgi:orotidine-5'-phosphate decarboxylase